MSNDGTLIRLREPKLYFDNVNIESVVQVEDSQHSVSQEITKLKGKLLALALATVKPPSLYTAVKVGSPLNHSCFSLL